MSLQVLCHKSGSLFGIPINSHGSFSSRNSSNQFGLLGCKLFHQSFLNMDSSITTFGSILAFITLSFTILHLSRCSGYISHFCNFFNFPTFLALPSRALRRLMPSTQLELFPLFHSLCLGDSVFVCIHLCFSR